MLIVLLVLLNAPQFLVQPGRQGNLIWHTPVKSGDGAERPECHMPLRAVVIGPRNGLANRVADIEFAREDVAKDCPHVYSLMVFARVLSHEEAFELGWRNEFEKPDHRCPMQLDRSIEAGRGHMSLVDLDLRYTYFTHDGRSPRCLPRLSFAADTSLMSLDRQIVVVSDQSLYLPGAAERRPDAVEVVSRNLLEDVSVRHAAAGRQVSIVLNDYRVGSVVGILNIVLASLLGVAAAAIFSRAAREG